MDPSQDKASVRLTVPCGKCGACRHNRRSDWSFRLAQELKVSTSCYFITLTYAEEHVPIVDPNAQTLVKKDLQDWLKRLRKHQSEWSDQKIRYYAVGEYGTSTNRPHYHIIAYNLCQRTLGNLGKIWTTGHYRIDPINQARIHYITKYHVNKSEKEDYGNREPEFTTMSRRPGIGQNYTQNCSQWHRHGDRNYVVNNGYKQRIPRYYKDKIFDSKLIKDRFKKETIELSDKNYQAELDRLRDLKIKRPDIYITQSALKQAQKVKDKAQEKDQI